MCKSCDQWPHPHSETLQIVCVLFLPTGICIGSMATGKHGGVEGVNVI